MAPLRPLRLTADAVADAVTATSSAGPDYRPETPEMEAAAGFDPGRRFGSTQNKTCSIARVRLYEPSAVLIASEVAFVTGSAENVPFVTSLVNASWNAFWTSL